MKLVILSDSHGAYSMLCKALEREDDADAIIHLGDGARDIQRWQEAHPGRRVYQVRGNCDYDTYAPDEGVLAFDGLVFFYTHGHNYSVKMTRSLLAEAAAARGAQVALYGHTHYPLDTDIEGVRVFNPGSVSFSIPAYKGCYGIIETGAKGTIKCRHEYLDQFSED